MEAQGEVCLADDKEIPAIATKLPLGVTTDEEVDGTIRVCLVFPGLRRKLFRDASNATISVDIKEQSLEVSLVMTEKTANKVVLQPYKYSVKKLPDKVIPAKCTHKVKKDMLIIKLHKENERSWVKELADVGLETCYEDP